MEHWVVHPTYQDYEVSDRGRVRNVHTGRVLKPYPHPRTGLLMLQLKKNLRACTTSVHRLVAEAHIAPGREGFVPIHIDGNRHNNYVGNLEWKTLSFARSWKEELERQTPTIRRPVVAIDHDKVFEHPHQAARALGGLEHHIIIAAGNPGIIRYLGTEWAWHDTYYERHRKS